VQSSRVQKVAEDSIVLDAQKMIRDSKSLVRLEEFDSDDVEQKLSRPVDAANAETVVNADGHRRLHAAAVYLLCNRLLLQRFLQEHPELKDGDIGPAIMIVGVPRTGSTKLQRLIAQDGRLDHLKFWETIFPLAYPGERDNEDRLKLVQAMEKELDLPRLTA
jgi:hypothetical protein